MINFRFHVVSLIAIFLALALGVVIGAGVIDRGVVNTLNDRLDSVEAKSERIKGENDALADENSRLSGAIAAEEPFAVDGRLVGETTGIVAVRGVDEGKVKATAAAARTAGATVPGVLWVEDKWNLADAAAVKDLQDALGVTIKNKAALRTEAWRRLGARLATPPAEVGTDDLLAALVDAGFLSYDSLGANDAISAFPGRGASLTLVTGTDAKVPSANVVVPAANGVHGAAVPLVSTVDDLDQPMGPTTVVLALADLLRTPPVVGHYGYGPGTQPLPSPVGA